MNRTPPLPIPNGDALLLAETNPWLLAELMDRNAANEFQCHQEGLARFVQADVPARLARLLSLARNPDSREQEAG